jgi:hypothetical protein
MHGAVQEVYAMLPTEVSVNGPVTDSVVDGAHFNRTSVPIPPLVWTNATCVPSRE